MLDINIVNFITVALIALITVVLVRWLSKAMGKEAMI